MRNFFALAVVAFVVWAAATGRLMNWVNLARTKIGI